MMWYETLALQTCFFPDQRPEGACVLYASHFFPICHRHLYQSTQVFFGHVPFTCQRTILSWSFLFQPSIRKQFLIILRAPRRHTRSARARQLMAVERAAAGISVIDIAFRIDCQILSVSLSLSIRQHALREVASRERLTREALFGSGNATTDLLCADEWHVSSGPDKECDSDGCENDEEGESGDLKASGDAHCEKTTLSFLLEGKRQLRNRS